MNEVVLQVQFSILQQILLIFMSEWPYPYCPHQAFNKNITLRMASIPYSFVPDPTIDAFTNINIKCANLDKHNIPSLAYQQYFCGGQTELDTNFAKDFYLQIKDTNAIKFDNTIVQQKKKQLEKGNAYVLAASATDEYQKFQQNRKNALDNARRRATSTLIAHINQKKDTRVQQNIESGEWLKKLYRKLEQIAKHIVEGEGESAEQKEKLFLLSKSNLTANYLSQIKIRNPKTAFEILQEMRTLMLKKKLKFQNQRQEQEKNKSVSMSYTSEASQNTSQGSMLSQATSVNQSNIDGEQEVLSKFCDFQNLSRKWGVTDVQHVKYLLRLMLTRKFVSQAELNAVKKKKEAQKINQSLQKLNPQLAKKIEAQKNAKKDHTKAKRVQITKPTKKDSSTSENILKPTKPALTKQEQQIKQKLVGGGQFDAIGQKFSRNRNYSNLFTKKQKQITIEFTVKQKQDSRTQSAKENLDTKACTFNKTSK